MSSNIEEQSFWHRLSYSSQQQAKKLIKLQKKLSTMFLCSGPATIAAAIYLFPLMLDKNINSSNYIFPIFVILLIAYAFASYISSVKKEFNELKKHTMAYIKTEFCTCSKKDCECKEEYIKFMKEVMHINLCY